MSGVWYGAGMRVVVVGAGAVGGYYGALLHAGGHDVVFVARGATLAALQASGLRVERADGVLALAPVQAVATLEGRAPADVALICVKSHDTRAAAALLAPAVGPETIVLSLQNGVENEAILAEVLGIAPLLVAFTQIGVEATAPGVVAYSGRGEIYLGEPDGPVTTRATRIASVFEQAGIPCRVRPDILVGLWQKLAWNAGFNAVTTLSDTTVGRVVDDPALAALVVAAMREVDAVATARGIPVARGRLPGVMAESRRGLAEFATSMLQDRRRARPLEVDGINGAVLRAADRCGVPVPVNRALHGLLMGVTRPAG
jgi:2-dehydropantoate 2-reductase